MTQDSVAAAETRPPSPNGWFAVAFSSDLKARKVLRTSCAGRDIVLFRTVRGVLRAVDPYCPHLGADLGGGRVVGERLVCPFHEFAYGTDGVCAATRYGQALPRIRLRLWDVREVNGYVFVWHHAGGLPPQWEIPRIHDGHAAERMRSFPGVLQDIAENAVDFGHFVSVHRTTPNREIEATRFTGHTVEIALAGAYPMSWGGSFSYETTITLWGLGFSVHDLYAPPDAGVYTRVLIAANATSAGQVDVRMRVAVQHRAGRSGRILPERAEGRVLRMLSHPAAAVFTRAIADDIPILQRKVYLSRPRLAQGDGPIGPFRRWVEQFYGEAAAPAAGADGGRRAVRVRQAD